MGMTPVFGEFGMPDTFYTHTHTLACTWWDAECRCRTKPNRVINALALESCIRERMVMGTGNQVGEWPSAIDFMPSLFSLRVCALWVHKVNGLKKHISLSGNFNKYVQFIRSHAPIERNSNQECFPTSQLKQRIITKKSYEFKCTSIWWKSFTWIQWLTT